MFIDQLLSDLENVNYPHQANTFSSSSSSSAASFGNTAKQSKDFIHSMNRIAAESDFDQQNIYCRPLSNYAEEDSQPEDDHSGDLSELDNLLDDLFMARKKLEDESCQLKLKPSNNSTNGIHFGLKGDCWHFNIGLNV